MKKNKTNRDKNKRDSGDLRGGGDHIYIYIYIYIYRVDPSISMLEAWTNGA